MKKNYILCLLFIFALEISGCSSGPNQPAVPTPTERPDAYLYFPTVVPANSARMPVTWASLNLTGKLVYNMGAVDKDNNFIIQIQVLDLVTGDITVVYTAPLNAWIYYVSVSPDNKQVVMSFSPPPQENLDIVQALYVMPLDSSSPPQLLFTPPTREDQYIQAEWSPDGKYIYYTHVNNQIPDDPNRHSPLYEIFRMEFPGGQPESIAKGAYWPRLSPDFSRLVYIAADPLSAEQQLTIADPDGGNAQEVALSGVYIPDDKAAPIFSPNGQSVIFSGVVAGESYQPRWFEKLLGIGVAKAGEDYSDWWSVPAGGGEITRLTKLETGSLYAGISPDNQYIGSFSKDQIFVMKPDGSELTILIPGLSGFFGTVNWIP